nr:2OG-Fe(II) oxygenase [uncultured Rhodoferax sp.]
MSTDTAADPLEAWFAQAATKANCRPEHLAAAMQEDGFAQDEAWLLAALAHVRYSPLSLTEMIQSSTFADIANTIRRHGASASLGARMSARQEQRATAQYPFDEVCGWPNRIELAGGVGIDVQFASYSPRAALLHGFLSPEECDGLIELARHRIRASEVSDSVTGTSMVDSASRNSAGTFLRNDESSLVANLRSRAEELLGWPATHFEEFEVTRYEPGAEFREHMDCLERDEKPDFKPFGDAGDRIATLVLYLNEVEEGGATQFPVAGVEVRPHRGSALFFAYQEPDGLMDASSLHAGMPVVRGCKWIATLWIHAHALVDSPEHAATHMG